jgi:hypothetical protein
MSDRRLEQVSARLVRLLRNDPPRRASPLTLDRWILSRLSREEIELVLQAEREYGEEAMAEWLGEILVEAGLASRPLAVAV